MKLIYNGNIYESKSWSAVGFEIEGGTFIILSDGDEIRPDIPPLYKQRGGGELMKFTWTIRRDSNKLIIQGLILEEGRSPRAYSSVVAQKSGEYYLAHAVDKLLAKWTHKKNKDGWSESGNVGAVREPVLLQRWDKAKKKKGPWLVSPKLDGIRGTFHKSEGQIFSRKRGIFFLPTIVEQLQELGIDADGELWHPAFDWETISGTVSRDTENPFASDGSRVALEKKDLQFHIFDRCDLNVPYVDRLASLIDLDLSGFPNLRIVPSVFCRTNEEAEETYERLLLLKYEGGVARRLDAPYQWDVRSWDVLKMKPVFSKEFILQNITYDEDATYGKLISYICRTKEGRTFKATPAKSKQERAADYQKLRGMPILEDVWLTVEYRDKYSSGLPKFAVVKGIRNINM